ncbi:MAG: TolC family protein [Gammaproteobacteria bacterium]|nr:TolC family protein [Gammaproteobacteria bacterium]
MKWLVNSPIILLLWAHSNVAVHAAPMTMRDVTHYALEHNPALHAAEAASNASRYRHRAAKGQRLPRLDLSYVVRRSNNPLDVFADKLNTRQLTSADFDPLQLNNPDISEIHNTRLNLSLPIYTGGRLGAQIRQAGEVASAHKYRYLRQRDFIIFQTQAAYHALGAAIRATTITRDALTAAKKHAKTTRKLVRDGRIVLSDKLTAEVYQASMRGIHQQALTQRQLAESHLRRVMGLPPQDPLQIPTWSKPDASINIETRDKVTQRALTKRQDLSAMQALIRASEAGLRVEQAAYKPRVDLIASNDWFASNPALSNRSWRVMGAVQLNLFAGGSHNNNIAAAHHEATNRQLQLKNLELDILDEVQQAYERLNSAILRYQIAIANVTKANKTVGLVNERYGQGRTLLIDLLQAERTLLETRNEALASALTIKTQWAALHLASGNIADPPVR